MIELLKRNPFNRRPGSSLLGLAFDGSRLDGVAVRRTNGSVEATGAFSAALSLDLLTNDPELVGREIRKHLEAAGVRERWCVVCLPLSWALTLTTKLPELTGADLESFLQIEAERGFPYGPDALMLARSTYRTAGGEAYATLVGVPRDHLSRLETVLHAAQLRPVSFSLGLAALQRADPDPAQGVLALLPGEHHVGLQVACGGGLVTLRAVDGAFEGEGPDAEIRVGPISRELRVTLGQLPEEVRESVRRVRVFGRGEAADALAEDLHARMGAQNFWVERVREYPADEFSVKVPARTEVSPAFSLAVQHLTGVGATLQLLPPKVSAWTRFTARHASRKLVWAGTAAAAAALLVLGAFLVQQWQLAHWRSRWTAISTRVTELETIQQNIRKYRPWYDESFRSLSILRRLSESFPSDGSVSAKTVEIRESPENREPPKITCVGTARNNQALLQTIDKLNAAKGISGLRTEQIRGKSPLEFTLNFHWNEATGP
jgi:ABC-type multidrug transport system fused ATPase/permease subunit